MGSTLHVPEEPLALLAEAQEFLHRAPADGLDRIDDGEWITDTLWPVWREPLRQAGIEREQFRQFVIGYRNEVRLWIMGERPWTHCVEGLIGRVERRMKTESG